MLGFALQQPIGVGRVNRVAAIKVQLVTQARYKAGNQVLADPKVAAGGESSSGSPMADPQMHCASDPVDNLQICLLGATICGIGHPHSLGPHR